MPNETTDPLAAVNDIPTLKIALLAEVRRRQSLPTKDDAFMWRHAGRMFILLSGVDNHPPGCPINDGLRLEIQKLFQDAYEDGIDIIGASECGLPERTYYSGEVNNG